MGEKVGAEKKNRSCGKYYGVKRKVEMAEDDQHARRITPCPENRQEGNWGGVTVKIVFLQNFIRAKKTREMQDLCNKGGKTSSSMRKGVNRGEER